MRRPWQFETEWIRWLFSVDVLLPVLALPGLWGLWRMRGRAAGLPALVLVLHPIGMALLAPYRGPGFQEGRYSIHLLPLAIAVALAGVAALGARGGSMAPRALARGGLLAAALWTLPGRRDALRLGGAEHRRDAGAARPVDRRQHAARMARIALNDVGAIAYLSRREVVDVMGLVTPAIIPYRQEGEPGVLSYLERSLPGLPRHLSRVVSRRCRP